MATLKSRDEAAVIAGFDDWDQLDDLGGARLIQSAAAHAEALDELHNRTEEDERDREMLDFYYKQTLDGWGVNTPMGSIDKKNLAALKAIIAKYGPKDSLENGKVYAVTDYHGNPDITAGKLYKVDEENMPSFKTMNDTNSIQIFRWNNSPALDGNNWVRVIPQGGEA